MAKMNANRQTTKIVGLGNIDTRLQEIRDNLQSLLMSNQDLVIKIFLLFYLEVLYGILLDNHHSRFNQVTNILRGELFWEKRRVLKDELLGRFEEACSNLNNPDEDGEKRKDLIRKVETQLFDRIGHEWVLRLRGPKGDRGEKGEKGERGEQGPSGQVPDLDGILKRLTGLETRLEELNKLKPKLNLILYLFPIAGFILLSIILIATGQNGYFWKEFIP
jgi:hypothetical protein